MSKENSTFVEFNSVVRDASSTPIRQTVAVNPAYVVDIVPADDSQSKITLATGVAHIVPGSVSEVRVKLALG